METKKHRVSRIVYLCIGVVYLLAVLGATLYGLTLYKDNLPQVELIRPERGRLPSQCLMMDARGAYLNTVERQDGPWGKRYVVKQVVVYSYQKVDQETTYAYEAVNLEAPVVLRCGQALYDGMEVRVG